MNYKFIFKKGRFRFIEKYGIYLFFIFQLLFVNCAGDSIVSSNGEVAEDLKLDPLYKKYDQAVYNNSVFVLQKALKKYADDKQGKYISDVEKEEKLKIMTKNILWIQVCKQKLFEKYPELRANETAFKAYFDKNRARKLSSLNFYPIVKDNKANLNILQ